MKKVILVIIIIIVFLTPFFKYYYDIYTEKKIIEEYQKDKQKKENPLHKLYAKNSECNWILGLEGDFEITNDGIVVSDLKYDKTKSYIFIYYYNYYNDSDITFELIMQEYDNFCKGLEDYKHLKDFTDFIMEMYKSDEISPDKIHSDVFLYECILGLNKTYGDIKNLSEEEVVAVCDTVMEHKYEICLHDIVSRIYIDFNQSLFDEYTREEIDSCEWLNVTQETNEKVICNNNGDVVYFKLYKNWYTNEESYRINKIVINEEHIDLSRLEKILEGFKLVVENEYKTVYAWDEIYIIFELNEDGECNRITMKIKE